MEPSTVEIVPPTAISERHGLDLLRGLDFGHAVELLSYKPPDVAFKSGGGSTGVQLLEWILTITQTHAWEWMAAFLTGYGGKEFLKGFAGDAGKDFWKAVKFLALRISGDNHLDASAKKQINITTKDNSNQPGLSVKIDPRWFGSDEGNRIVRGLEEVMLPSLAGFLDSSGRRESNQQELLDVYIKPVRREPVGWELSVMRRASPWGMEVNLRGEPMEVEWDTRDGTLDWRSKALLDEFSVNGVSKIRQVKIFTRG